MIKRKDITARKIRLDRDGYDSSGAYWGLDLPLYWVAFVAPDRNEHSETIRAKSRKDAVDYAMREAAKY